MPTPSPATVRPPPVASAAPAAARGGPLDRAVLALHRLADRFDLLPPEFAEEGEINESDARAVAGEWRRCLRLWAAYSPEQVFALKIGAVLLLAALAGLWLVVGWID